MVSHKARHCLRTRFCQMLFTITSKSGPRQYRIWSWISPDLHGRNALGFLPHSLVVPCLGRWMISSWLWRVLLTQCCGWYTRYDCCHFRLLFVFLKTPVKWMLIFQFLATSKRSSAHSCRNGAFPCASRGTAGSSQEPWSNCRPIGSCYR